MKIKHIAAAAALAVAGTLGLGSNAQAVEPAHVHTHAAPTSATVPAALLGAAPAGMSAASYGITCWLIGHSWRYVRSWRGAGVRNSLYVCTRDGATKIIRLI